jgi:phospholipid/cholesterol/gamma-HCH transport system substrate-binding protein
MRRKIVIGSVIILAFGAVIGGAMWSKEYQPNVLLTSGAGLILGSKVLMHGFEVGQVNEISVKDGKALVKLGLDNADAPLHDGARVSIVWKAVLGERQIEVVDGPASNAAIPDGGMIMGQMDDPVEMDKVLGALDPQTRQHLRGEIGGLATTVAGNEGDLKRTLETAGPALGALGQVLRGLGSDGPAIKDLVSQLDSMTGTLSDRDLQVRAIVEQLSGFVNAAAQQREQLQKGLEKLPGTLATAQRTLGDIPGAVDEAVPLLEDLKPGMDRLPPVAAKMRPILTDLRPTVGDLRPMLEATDSVLQSAPDLLDSAHATLPGAATTFNELSPALNFIRPYTPEIIGWFANWGSSAANYDSHGHYMRVTIPGGPSSFVGNPGPMPPGFASDSYPAPGAIGGQPWTDAFGSGMR